MSMNLPLPPDTLYKTLDLAPLSALQLALCNRLTSQVLLRESDFYWKRQCILAGYTSAVPSQVPIRLERPTSWLGRFREHYIAETNWRRCSFVRRTLPICGQVCLFLDGHHNRALSATLPLQSPPRTVTTFWDLETGQSLYRLDDVGGGTCVARLLSEGSLLASGLRDGCLLLKDLRTNGTQAELISAHGGEVNALCFGSPNMLLSGSTEGVAKTWDLRMLTCQDSIYTGAPVTSILSRSDGDKSTIVASIDGTVKILHPSRVTRTLRFPGSVNCLDDYQANLIVGLDNGSLFALHEEIPTILWPGNGSAIVSMHGAEQYLVVGTADGTLNYSCGKQNLMWHTIDEQPRGIIWQVFADASRIISSSLDQKLLVHDFSSRCYYPT